MKAKANATSNMVIKKGGSMPLKASGGLKKVKTPLMERPLNRGNR